MSTELDRAVAAVRTDPAVRTVVEHLLRTHDGGAYVHGEPEALTWVAWDAYHAVEWGRDPALADLEDSVEAIIAAFYDTGLHGEGLIDDALAVDVQQVLVAIGAD